MKLKISAAGRETRWRLMPIAAPRSVARKSARSNSEHLAEGSCLESSVVAQGGTIHMPCGARARLTAYVAYQTLAFAERDVLLAALADVGFARVEIAPSGTEDTNPIPVLDASRRLVGSC